MLGSSPWRTQIEQCHHALGTLVIDAQMQRYPAMSMGRIVTMDGFNLAFKCQVFGRLPSLTIDVFRLMPNALAQSVFCFDCRTISTFFERASSAEGANQALQFFVLTFQLVEVQHGNDRHTCVLAQPAVDRFATDCELCR